MNIRTGVARPVASSTQRKTPASPTRSPEGGPRSRADSDRSAPAKPAYQARAKSGSSMVPRTVGRTIGKNSPRPAFKAGVKTVLQGTRPVEGSKAMDFLSGRNPVMEALRSGRPISKIYISAGDHQGSLREIIALAKEKEIPVQTTEQAKLEAMSLGVRAQGVVAMVSPVAYSSVEDMVALAVTKNEHPCLLLLDQLKDPQNLGAVLRTVDAAGAHGVLIPQRRSCQLSAAVAKASEGESE